MTKAALICLAAGMASAQTVSLTVNTDTVLHGIDPKIYGQFLEHIYHSVNGGIWGEVVWNRSFEETLTQGAWKVNGGVLEAAGGNGDSRFRFGAETWRDYDLAWTRCGRRATEFSRSRCAAIGTQTMRCRSGARAASN